MQVPSSQALPLLSSFTTFLTIAIHSLLYHRALYPPETFLASRAYNLPVRQSRHPGLCAWIADAVSAIAAQLRATSTTSSSTSTPAAASPVDRVVLAIHHPERFRVLERWVFDVSRFPGDWGADYDVDPDYRAQEGSPVNWADVDESLRGALARIAQAADRLAPLPEGCTFTLAVELRDDAAAPITHPQEWIPSEPHMQPSQDVAPARTTIPVRSVHAGPLFFECWAETPKPDAAGSIL